MNFRDKDNELSLYIAAETTPETALAGHEGFGLVYLTAGQIRDACGAAVIIRRDDIDPANGHVLVGGKVTGGMAKKLSKAAQWFENRFPARGESPTGQTDDG